MEAQEYSVGIRVVMHVTMQKTDARHIEKEKNTETK